MAKILIFLSLAVFLMFKKVCLAQPLNSEALLSYEELQTMGNDGMRAYVHETADLVSDLDEMLDEPSDSSERRSADANCRQAVKWYRMNANVSLEVASAKFAEWPSLRVDVRPIGRRRSLDLVPNRLRISVNAARRIMSVDCG